jgi:uncharacterized protein (TIGR00730 family)
MSVPVPACWHVGVFCGAKSGDDPRWVNAAFDLGRALGERGWTLVYGGGNVGLMGALADGALAAGGAVVGVIPRRLLEREVAHRGLSRLEVVADMAERKTRMIELADAFLTLPGGLGTLDEFFEVLTLAQIGYHDKRSVLLDQVGYWQPLLAAVQSMVAHGFVRQADLASLRVVDSMAGALEALAP